MLIDANSIGDVWERATTPVPAPDVSLVAVLAAMALAVVMVTPVWRVARNVITIAHEGSHALAGLLTGRRLSGIRLHSDTSGLTVSVGKSHGFGMVLVAFAGYVGPGLMGLGAAALLRRGYAIGLLWLLIALLAITLLGIRNAYGLWAVLVCGALLFAISWWGSDSLQADVAYVVTWFLLLGAVRPVIELQAERRRKSGSIDSDADVLAKLSHLPGIFWVAVFFLCAVVAAVVGGSWILGSAT